MVKKNKAFRVNVVISYDEHLNLNKFQRPIHTIFRHLAWLHRLEFAIVDICEFMNNSDLGDNYSEIVFFRSTESTFIAVKAFKQLILDTFKNSIPASEGIDVFFQMQKFLTKNIHFLLNTASR